MNSCTEPDTLVKGSLSEHLYNTASLLELGTKLAAGPTTMELRRYGLTKEQWIEQLNIAMSAIGKD